MIMMRGLENCTSFISVVVPYSKAAVMRVAHEVSFQVVQQPGGDEPKTESDRECYPPPKNRNQNLWSSVDNDIV